MLGDFNRLMLYRETRKNACYAAYDTHGNRDFASCFDWFVVIGQCVGLLGFVFQK